MNGLAFLSPNAARDEDGFAPRQASPLARALAGSMHIRDLSLFGKVELRGGDVPDGVEAIRITPHRVLLLCPPERCAELVETASGLAVDLTRVHYLDSTGIALLYELHLRLRRRRQGFVVISPAGTPPRRVLELTAFDQRAALAEDLEGAVAALRAG